jgi:hypothetical protein
MATNLYGAFVWWTGSVVNRVDPLGLGRLQIRIFGYFDDIPDEDLPWSMVMYPINGSMSFSAPKQGTWVIGFFADRENAQFPIALGVIPGLVDNSDYAKYLKSGK